MRYQLRIVKFNRVLLDGFHSPEDATEWVHRHMRGWSFYKGRILSPSGLEYEVVPEYF